MLDDLAKMGSRRPFHGGPPAGSSTVMSDLTFEALMSEHHAEIYRYILRGDGAAARCRRPLAGDLPARVPGAPDTAARRELAAWLFAIATNLTRNHFRSQKRRRLAYQAVVTETRETDGERPDGVTLSQELGTAVEHVVAKLPLKQRLAFLQRKVHGLEYDAIGQSLQCSAETARAHVFQALRKVRRALEGRELIGKEFACEAQGYGLHRDRDGPRGRSDRRGGCPRREPRDRPCRDVRVLPGRALGLPSDRSPARRDSGEGRGCPGRRAVA